MAGEVAIVILVGMYGVWTYFVTRPEKKKRRRRR